MRDPQIHSFLNVNKNTYMNLNRPMKVGQLSFTIWSGKIVKALAAAARAIIGDDFVGSFYL